MWTYLTKTQWMYALSFRGQCHTLSWGKETKKKESKGQLAGAEISRWRLKKQTNKHEQKQLSLDYKCTWKQQRTASLEVQLVLSALFSSAIVLILSTVGKGRGSSFYFTHQPQRGYVCNCWGDDLQSLRVSAGGRVKACFSTPTELWKLFNQSLKPPFLQLVFWITVWS